MNKNKYRDLAKKISRGEATDHEIYIYNKWFNAIEKNSTIDIEDILTDTEQTKDDLLKRINNSIDKGRGYNNIVKGKFWKLAIASSVVLFAMTWLYFNIVSVPDSKVYVIANDIDPGGNKATLTLADGSIVALGQQSRGQVISDGPAKVIKQDEGLIVYQNEDGLFNMNTPYQYHRVTTPLGGKYQIVLPDNSKVYLNAGSSIQFPTSFSDHSREVELEGEGFFEVSNDLQRPFLVHCQEQTIEVLGTQFNVNSYKDETSIKTTLIEGSVKVKIDTLETVIRPGQQFSLTKDGHTDVTKVDVEQVIAWRNNLFHFWNTDIKDIMKQLSRWYDIDVTYDGNLSSEYISGFISRDVTISNVIHMLEETGNLRFSVEGKKVTVHHIEPQD
ncbi:FecR family protein [Membranihabitans marinus]|uniref:FecR family protein n=1 Tax=Membranihabitans marinus TaxID=1227546 RepID=UPI001F2171D0|nr:FecR family protein [Membranihabitans marinus]